MEGLILRASACGMYPLRPLKSLRFTCILLSCRFYICGRPPYVQDKRKAVTIKLRVLLLANQCLPSPIFHHPSCP